MKKILLTIITLSVLIPNISFGAFSVPWNATSTSQGWISPNTINSVYPVLYALRYIASSTSLASIFPYASTTAMSATTICFTGDTCRTTWPTSSVGGAETWSTTTSQVSGQFINYPNNNTDVVSIGATATSSSLAFFDPNTLLNKFKGTVMIGDVTSPQADAFGTSNYELQIEKNKGDIVGQTIWNTNSTSTLAGSGLFLNNGFTPHGGIGAAGKYYAGFVLAGPSWNGTALGFGALPANGAVVYNTDGSLILGSATSTGRIDGYVGAGSFSGGIPDFSLIANNANFGLSTSTPTAKLSVHGLSTDTAQDLFKVASSTNSATTTLLVINKDGATGIGTSTPRALLDLHRTTSFDPSLAVNGGFGGTDIARFYRDASTGMGVAFLVPGSIPQISYRVGMSSLGAGIARNSLLVDSAGATFRISTSTTNAVNDIEPFVVKNSNSFVGIASTSPYAQFSINPLVYNSGAPSFVIGSSTATRFIVNSSGYVGIGTSTPNGPLNVSVGSSLYTSLAPLFVENSGSSATSYVAQFSSGSATGNSYPSFNVTNSGSTILNSRSPFLGYGTNVSITGGGAESRGQLVITNGASATNWFNIFVDSSTNANLSSNGPIRIFKTLGGSSDIFNIASSTSGAASTTYMTVDAYGNVGIGTSTMFRGNRLTVSNSNSTAELSLTNGTLTSPQWAFNVLQNGDLAIATSSPVTGATSTLNSLLLTATGNVGIGTSTPVAVINGYAVTASSTNLLLDAVSKGGCFIMKDVNGTGYSQFTAQGGVLTGKVATSLNQCN